MRWMGLKYVGSFVWTIFNRRRYQGIIHKVGWCAVRGYAARVGYSDGYWEMIPLRELKKRHVQEEIKTSGGGQKSLGSERCTTCRVGSKYSTTQKQISWDDGSTVRVLRKLNLKYKEATVRKEFGYLGDFTGLVNEIWEHEELGFLANVFYEDNDVEDITLRR